MLLIMVSLIAVCQYPITKKIGDQEVVIMTTKQAEAINDKFLRMQDSIKKASSKVVVVQTDNKYLLDSIKNLRFELKETSNKVRQYQQEVGEYRNSFYQVNREYKKSTVGIFLATALFLATATIFAKTF